MFNGDISLLSESEIKQAFESIESTIIDNDSLTLTELLVKSNIAKSNRESRELITNNSITLNGVKVNDTEKVITKKDTIHNLYTIIKKGKRNYFVIKWK